MKKTTTLISLLSAVCVCAQGATGVFGSYIGINPNGSGNAWYGALQWGDNSIQAFDGANLGTFDLGDTLEISAFQVQTFKSNGGDVEGIELQYRVYEQSAAPGAFNVVAGGFLADATFLTAAGNSASGGGDQNWGVDPTASLGNLIAGITLPGTYNVEVFFRAATNEGDRFSNNGGSNFTGEFSVIPEPSSYAAIVALGALALTVSRRSRRQK